MGKVWGAALCVGILVCAAAWVVLEPPAAAGPPKGSGYLCVEPASAGDTIHDFLDFRIHRTSIRGYIVEQNISTRAEIPMIGTLHGTKISLGPLDGFGGFVGTLNGQDLNVDEPTPGAPVPVTCSVESVEDWRATASHLKSWQPRNLSTSDFLAEVDFSYAGSGRRSYDSGHFITPLRALVRSLSASRPFYPGGQRIELALPPRLTYRAGPVSAPNALSVNVGADGGVMVLATRSTSGTCWYMVTNSSSRRSNDGLAGVPMLSGEGKFSTVPGVFNRSCSATDLPERLVAYPGV